MVVVSEVFQGFFAVFGVTVALPYSTYVNRDTEKSIKFKRKSSLQLRPKRFDDL